MRSPPRSFPPPFTSADQIRWALEAAANLCGLTQKQLARALGAHEVVMSYWMAGARYPAPEVWHRLIAVVARWLTLPPAITRPEAERLASALVMGPFWLATPAVWGATLRVDPSVFAAVPADARGLLTGVDVGQALADALRTRYPLTPGDPSYETVRTWHAIERLHAELTMALSLRHEGAEAVRMVQRKNPAVYRKVMAEAKKQQAARAAQSSRRRGRGK